MPDIKDLIERASHDIYVFERVSGQMSRDLIDALTRSEKENAELREDRDRTARNRDMWKGQCERQAEQLTQMRAAINVVIETQARPPFDPEAIADKARAIARAVALTKESIDAKG